jgi:hypothetical protein
MVTGSVKVDRYFENGGIYDHTLFSGRAGYIFHNEKWTSKTFLMYYDTPFAMRTLYFQRFLYRQTDAMQTEHDIVLSSQLARRFDKNTRLAFLAARTFRKNVLHFALQPNPVTSSLDPLYKSFDETMYFDSFLLELDREIFPMAHLRCQGWQEINHYQNGVETTRSYGFSTSLTATVEKFDFHTDMIYKYFESSGRGLDVNFAVTYHPSRRLTLFMKANNILGDAEREDYYTYNPITHEITRLDDVELFDKRVWVGLEYQF